MDKTVVINPQKKPGQRRAFSSLLFVSFILLSALVISLLNPGWINHVLMPIGADIGMFQLIWPEQPLSALEFIVTKSLFVLTHHDPRSGLNLWTVEYDSVTLGVYLLAAILGGRLINRGIQTRYRGGLLPGLLGMALLVIAFTYMSNIEHCSGATWIGFVSLYGMGFSGFDFYPYYQGIFALTGLVLLVWGLIKQGQTNK